MAYTTRTYTVGPDDTGRRADRILRRLFRDMPLSAIYRMFRDGAVRISGSMVSGSHKIEGAFKVETGQTLEIRLQDSPAAALSGQGAGVDSCRESGSGRFSDILILETPDIAVINKPRGMLTHGPEGVDKAARAYYAGRMAGSLSFVPAPLHRLDRNSSGALAVSASLRGAKAFSEALRQGRVGKVYLAILGGRLPGEQVWEDSLSRDPASRTSATAAAGEAARARAIPLAVAGGRTLAVIQLGTGRTHQIRVQAAARRLALAGDVKYGGQRMAGGYVLHCSILAIPPLTEDTGAIRAEAPLSAADLQRIIGIFGEAALRELRAFLAGCQAAESGEFSGAK